jgi:hypothetical protein
MASHAFDWAESAARAPCQLCRHRPGRRMECPICYLRVGPYCWSQDYQRCVQCVNNPPEPDPEPGSCVRSRLSGESDAICRIDTGVRIIDIKLGSRTSYCVRTVVSDEQKQEVCDPDCFYSHGLIRLVPSSTEMDGSLRQLLVAA